MPRVESRKEDQLTDPICRSDQKGITDFWKISMDTGKSGKQVMNSPQMIPVDAVECSWLNLMLH